MSLSATLFGRDSFIHKATNILGLGIPGWLDRKFGLKPTEGPRLSDLSVQSSAYGVDIPRTYAKIAIAGNLVWLENNQLKERVHKRKSGGKGGANQKPAKTYSYSATFMLALCDGPIAAIGRIWCSDKLIYSPNSNDLSTVIASNQAARNIRFYYGTDSQPIDPRMEAALGVGNVPSYRGTAYLVFYDFELADFGNSLQGAQFKVEVFQSFVTDDPRLLLNRVINVAPPEQGFQPNGTIPDGSYTSAFYWDGNQATYEVDSYGTVGPGAAGFLPERGVGSSTLPVVALQSPNGIAAAGIGSYSTVSLPGVAGGVQFADGQKFKFTFAPYGSTNGPYILTNSSQQYMFYDAFADGGSSSGKEYMSPLRLVANWPEPLATADAPLIEVPRLTFYWTITEDYAYCLQKNSVSGDIGMSILTFDLLGMTLVRRVALDMESSLAGTFPYNGSYCDGEFFYCFTGIAGGSGSTPYEEFYKINVLTGETQVLQMPALTDSFAFTSCTIKIQNNLLYRLGFNAQDGAGGSVGHLAVYNMTPYAGTDILLSDLIKAECGHASLINESDLDVTELTDFVHGYRIDGGSIRAALEPLQLIYPFDVIMSGYKIKFLRRGKESMRTIPYGHLGATQGSDHAQILKESITQGTKLPTKTTISYIDADREYAVSEQQYEKPDPNHHNVNNEEMTIVLTADEAAQRAEIVTLMAWLDKNTFEFTLPLIYSDLEAGDVITIPAPWATYEFIMRSVEYTSDGKLKCVANPNSAAAYTSDAVGNAPHIPPDIVVNLGPSEFIPLDIPVIQEEIQNSLGFVGVAGSGQSSWPGCTLLQTNDDGQTWVELQGYSGPGTVGGAQNALAASPCTLIDNSVLRVVMRYGTLSSISRDQMLSGLHYVAYGRDGRWEIIRFQNATLIETGTYDVSGFVRGEFGTEWATGLHQMGDQFVVLEDADNAFIGLPIAGLLVPRTYRAVTSGADLETAVDIPFTYKGVNLECLSPVYPESERDGSGNLAFSVQRRSRLAGSWWVNGIESPVGETSLAFEADVMDGSVVKRTLTSSDGNFTYSAALQSTDFGSPQASVAIKIYQLSGVVGRGYPLETSV